MKKTVFLLMLLPLTLGIKAGDNKPIVSTTDIIFNMCPPIATNESAIVCHESDVPFVWNGIVTIPSEKEPGEYQLQRDILNDEGCTVNATMDLTVATCHPEGAILHKFSVGEGKYVYFSKGNLQFRSTSDGKPYHPDTNPDGLKHKVAEGGYAQGEWRFAEEQYDNTGDEAYGNHSPAANRTDWFELFGWGTSGYNGRNPWNTSNSSNDYAPSKKNLTGDYAYYDWGVYNAISNGGDEPGIWRVLSQEELSYLLGSRTIEMGYSPYVMWAGVTIKINTTNYYGIVLLPDDWTPDDDISWDYTTTRADDRMYKKTYDKTTWALMESKGAVFLQSFEQRTSQGSLTTDHKSASPFHTLSYWTSTWLTNQTSPYTFHSQARNTIYSTTWGMNYYSGNSVRLVTDVKPCDN